MTTTRIPESASRPDHQAWPHSPDFEWGARTPLRVLTHSAVGAYMACPRRYWWAYHLRIRKESAGIPLSIGAAFHAGLEAIHRGGSVESGIAAALAIELPEPERTIAASMVSGWAWRWSESPIGRIVAVEKTFEFRPSARSKWTIAGKIDAVAELDDGRLAVVENKTTREPIEPDSDYWRRLMIDRQISLYMLGARAIGYPVVTVVYDAARVPGIRPRLLSRKSDERESPEQFADRLASDMAERPDFYFARQEIPRIESDLDSALADMAHMEWMLRRSARESRWPRNTDSCRRWGVCPYFGPCTADRNPLTDGVPNGYVVLDDPHAELLQETHDDDGE